MPPILQKSLPVIAFSKNRIELKVHSENFRAAVPAKAVGKLLLTGMLAVNETISIIWANGKATLTAKAVPDDSGLQIPAGDGATVFVYAQIIWSYIKQNPFIDRDFEVTLELNDGPPYFLFTALRPGPEYNLTDIASPRYTISRVTTGVSMATLPNFMHFIAIMIRNAAGDAWLTAFRYNVALDDLTSGNTTLDIGKTMHAYLSLDIPALTGYWQRCSNSIRKYKIKYAAYYGDPAIVRQVSTVGEYVVVYGGYSKLAVQQIGNNANYLEKYLMPSPSLYKFQRWFEAWPIDKLTVKTNQPQFLYFINNRTVAETYQIKVKLVFDDGSDQTIYLNGGTLQPLQKVCIGCGYKQLGIDAYSTALKLVSYYTITLVSATDQTSRSLRKTFIINRDYEAYTRYFIYADSVGNFKTLRTFGTSQLSAEINADQVSLQTDTSQMPLTGNYRNSNIQSVHNDKVNTGYIASAREYDSLIELHQAKQVFRVIGNTLVPIVITSKNFNYSSDGASLNADLLEYRLAYEDDLYTASSYALPVPELNKPQQPLNHI